MAKIRGGEWLARMLHAEGVEKVFGIIDGTYFGFYEALHRLGIDIVTPRHETCAARRGSRAPRRTRGRRCARASKGAPVWSIWTCPRRS